MIHTVSGHNFHEHYEVRFRGPAEGFVLSPRQAAKYYDTLCGVTGCQCGGGYGEGPSEHGAAVIQDGWANDGEDVLRLVPEAERIAMREREAEEWAAWMAE